MDKVCRIIVLTVISSSISVASSGDLSGEAALLRNFQDGYVKARPRKDPGQTVAVNASMILHMIISLDGNQGVLTTIGKFYLSWYDEYLVWDPASYDDAQNTTMSAFDIWVPDVGILNSIEQVVNPDWQKTFPVRVYSDGLVQWSYSDLFKTKCDVIMTTFPFDQQTCMLTYGTLGNVATYVNLDGSSDSVDVDNYQINEEFHLSSTAVQYECESEHGSEGCLARLNFKLYLERRPAYYVLNVMVPTGLLSLITLLAFVMPPSSGERVSLQITVLLSLSVFQLILTSYVPVTSTNMPALSIAIALIMVITGLALVANVIVLRLYEPHPHRMSAGMRYFLLGCLGSLLCKHCLCCSTRKNDYETKCDGSKKENVTKR